jgi:hypothetical protein
MSMLLPWLLFVTRVIAVAAFAIAGLVAACVLVSAIVMGAARMIQRISQKNTGRRRSGPSGKC